jgi:hypothetical protein
MNSIIIIIIIRVVETQAHTETMQCDVSIATKIMRHSKENNYPNGETLVLVVQGN